jgi:hypothetical protein
MRSAGGRHLRLGLLDRVGVLDHLLRDGRGALDDAAGLEVGNGGTADPLHVDAAVLPEGAVLDRDRGIDQRLGNLVEGDRLAVLTFEARQERLPGAVVNVRGLRQLHVIENPRVGQSAREVVVRRQHVAAGANQRATDHERDRGKRPEQEGGKAAPRAGAPRGLPQHQSMAAPLHGWVHRALR